MHAIPGVDGFSTTIANDRGCLRIDGLILQEMPFQGVQRVVLICTNDSGQRLAQVLCLKLRRPERQC